MIIHDEDWIVPIRTAELLLSKLVKGLVLKVYAGGTQSLGDTGKDQLNSHLLAFLRS